MTAITAAATKTMSVRRATRLRFGLNPMTSSIASPDATGTQPGSAGRGPPSPPEVRPDEPTVPVPPEGRRPMPTA